MNWKPYIYTPGTAPRADAEFPAAAPYGKAFLGNTWLFWKHGLKRYGIDLSRAKRIFRRVDFVYGKLCLGGSSYDVQYLVLVLDDGAEVQIPIGDRMEKEAIALLEALKASHPEIAYGKE